MDAGEFTPDFHLTLLGVMLTAGNIDNAVDNPIPPGFLLTEVDDFRRSHSLSVNFINLPDLFFLAIDVIMKQERDVIMKLDSADMIITGIVTGVNGEMDRNIFIVNAPPLYITGKTKLTKHQSMGLERNGAVAFHE